MNYTFALADIAVGPAVDMYGFVQAALLLAGIILVEAAVLRALKWGQFRLCLLDSLLMNVVSTGVGLVTVAVLPDFSPIALVIMLVLSVLIEGWVLRLRRRDQARNAWLGAILANMASYIGIVLFLVVFPI